MDPVRSPSTPPSAMPSWTAWSLTPTPSRSRARPCGARPQERSNPPPVSRHESPQRRVAPTPGPHAPECLAHFTRNWRSTSPGIGGPLRPESVVHFARNQWSTSPEYAARAGATSLDELRGTPASELLEIPFRANIILDGHVLPRSPYEAHLRNGHGPIPVLVGYTADEGQEFIADRVITPANYTGELQRHFPGFLVRLAAPDPGSIAQEARWGPA